jgi:hypothetical protein
MCIFSFMHIFSLVPFLKGRIFGFCNHHAVCVSPLGFLTKFTDLWTREVKVGMTLAPLAIVGS